MHLNKVLIISFCGIIGDEKAQFFSSAPILVAEMRPD
jgi:hypothetical protein